eukprot:UN09465
MNGTVSISFTSANHKCMIKRYRCCFCTNVQTINTLQSTCTPKRGRSTYSNTIRDNYVMCCSSIGTS